MTTPANVSNVLSYSRSHSSEPPLHRTNVLLKKENTVDFHALLESVWKDSSDAMRITNSEGTIVAVNNAYCRLVGKTRGELVGELFTVAYDNTVDHTKLVDKYRTRFDEKSVEPLMSRQIRLSSGIDAFVESSNSYIEGSNGESYVLSIFRDATERRNVEMAFRASELKFRSVAQTAANAIISADNKSTITSWNDAARRMFGYADHEILGKSIGILMPERSRDAHSKGVERMRMGGEAHTIGRTVEMVGLRKNGTEFPVEISLSTWNTPEGPSFAAIIRDISERKTLESELSSAAEMARLGYWEYDVDSGKFTFSDQYFRLIHGSSAAKQGGNIMSAEEFARRLVHPEDASLVGKGLQNAIESPDPNYTVRQEARVFRENGEIANVTVQFKVLKDGSGRTCKVFGINQDITGRKQAEEALKKSEQRYRGIFENVQDVYYESDIDGTILEVSPSIGLLSKGQYSREDLIGRSMHDFYPDPEERQALLEAMQSRGRVTDFEIKLRNRDGSPVACSVSAIIHMDQDGRPEKIIGSMRDVTERKGLERALDRKRGLLRTVIDNLPDRVFAKDLEGKFIINNNAHILALGAQSQSDVVGKSDLDFRNRDVAEEMVRDDLEVIHSGESILEKEEQSVDQAGRSHSLLVTKVPMRDAQGAVVGLVGVSRDVTDRKAAIEALKESERRYHSLFSNAVQGMFQSTIDGRLLAANAALLKMLGYESFEELASRNLAEVYENSDDRRALSRTLAEQGSCSNVELRLKRRDGVIIQALEHSRALYDADGGLTGHEGILEDITERRALEARLQEHLAALKTSQESLAELNSQKDRLFSILSHDLRSPFTSILGFCEILSDDDEILSTIERKEFLGHIRNSAEKQMALLNKLLDWSRLETGRITFDVRDLDISEVVKNSISAHLGTAKKKEITLQSTLPAHMKIRGDEVMLSQVFANLISNALKFTPAHGLISVDLVQSGDDEWVVAVKDTGAGIPKEDFKKLFRIEEKYTRKGLQGEEGTGLGLSVVHEIVKKHSGSITVESEIGQGTVFSIRLPRLMEQTEYSVLVVDDDEGVRVLHSRFLKRIFPDAQIIQASDGKEAFEMTKRFHPRIIVTDYSMPEMNGFEFLNTLRQEPTTKDIPVLVITGKDSTASAEALRLSGAAAVLTKPVSSVQLQGAIEKVMAEKV